MTSIHDHTFIGIDVAQRSFDVATTRSRQVRHDTYDANGLRRLVKHLHDVEPRLVVMEATGGLERRLHHHLANAGFDVAIVNPRQIRDYARAFNQLAKTDKIDARNIASFAQTVQPRVSRVPEKHEEKLRSLTVRRRRIVQMRVAETNRLNRESDAEVCQMIRKSIAFFNRQREQVERSIAKIIEDNADLQDRAKTLRSAPGVGPVTTAALIAELPELGRLNRQEIAKLVGVAPMNRDSGVMRGKRVTGGGRGQVRKALYMATLSATRFNPIIRVFYQRLLENGKTKMTALVASMRKLLTILNIMTRENQPWRTPHNA